MTFGGVRAVDDDEAFVDVEIVTKLEMVNPDGSKSTYHYAPMEESDNVQILRRGVTR